MTNFDTPADSIKRLIREAAADTDNNVADFAEAARKRGRPVAKSAPTLRIHGDHNTGIVGNNNHVHITVKAPSKRPPKVVVQPGPDAITEPQAAEIRELVDKVAKVSGKPHQRVWGAVKDRFRFTTYHLMPAVQFEPVQHYLRRWIASETQHVPDHDAEAQRKKLLRRIHAQARKQTGLLDRIRDFANGRHSTRSLSELTAGQLMALIQQFGL